MLKQRLAAVSSGIKQIDASPPAYTSPTHTEAPVGARVNVCILGLVDVLSNASVCRCAVGQHELCGKEGVEMCGLTPVNN